MPHRLAIVPLLFVALLAIGCAPSLVDARAAVNRVSETYATTAPALEKQRMAAGDACFLDNPPGAEAVQRCLDGVRTRWRPVEAAVAALYVALVAAQSTVGTAEAAERIGRQPSVAQVMGVVARLLDAAVVLDLAVDGMRRDITRSDQSTNRAP